MSEDESDVVEKHCVACGDELEITIHPNGDYEGGHYFGEMELPAEDAEIESKEETEVEWLDDPVTVVSYDAYEPIEYWECDDCYEDDDG